MRRYMTPEAGQNDELVKALARTYARRITGVPNVMLFDRKSGNFTLSFVVTEDPAVAQLTTEVFVSTDNYYPNGVGWYSEPANAVTATFDQNSGLFQFANANWTAGQTVNITIYPLQ